MGSVVKAMASDVIMSAELKPNIIRRYIVLLLSLSIYDMMVIETIHDIHPVMIGIMNPSFVK